MLGLLKAFTTNSIEETKIPPEKYFQKKLDIYKQKVYIKDIMNNNIVKTVAGTTTDTFVKVIKVGMFKFVAEAGNG